MSTYRRRLRAVLIALTVSLSVMVWLPAQAKDDPKLEVRISALSPVSLKKGSTVTMTGTVTNKNSHTWKNTQAYLVIAHTPFTSRKQLDDAVSRSLTYTGERIVDLKAFDTMGDLQPGQSLPFQVAVPYKLLQLSGASGVYPVGIQILGTDVDGSRSNIAIGRATTFLPMLSEKPDKKVAGSVVWPFIMPGRRNTDGNYDDPKELLKSMSAGGQLRNLLDLATSTSTSRATAIVDPALLVAADDLSHDQHVAKSVKISDKGAKAAARFRDDLVTLARNHSCWIVGYDVPDVLALHQNMEHGAELNKTVDAATTAAMNKFGITGRRISWPTKGGATSSLIRSLRGPGDQPVIVNADDLSGWSRREGSLVRIQTDLGPVPLLVNDSIQNVPGQDSVVALRQRIASNSALAVTSRSIDPGSAADAVVVVDPTWNPGYDWSSGKLVEAFETPWTQGENLDEIISGQLTITKGTLPTTAKATPLSSTQLKAAAAITKKLRILDVILEKSSTISVTFGQYAASAVSVHGRKHPETALQVARADADRISRELGKISLEGPQSVTLSSSTGKFPLTIRNNTSSRVTVGVELQSSNPSLTIPNVDPITVEAGERHTLNVTADVGKQGSASLSARLTAPDGTAFGKPAVFNVRSSAVGVILWVAIGLAAALVIVAMVRRFSKHRSGNDRS